jgi:hypothetical protein
MENLLTAYDVVKAGTAGTDAGMRQQLMAAEMAAYGDAAQTNRIQNRLARMVASTGIDEQEKESAWKQSVTNMLTGAGTQAAPQQQSPAGMPPAPAAPAPQQAPAAPAGMPPAPTGQPTAPQQAPAAPAGMPPAPTGQPTAPQQAPAAPKDAYEPLFQATQPGGQLYQQDPQRAMKLNDEIKVKRSTEQWDKLKIAAEEGKISDQQQKELQTKFEPVIRAMVPLTQEYEKQIAKGVPPEKALASVQPAYQQLLKDMSQVPGFEQAAKMAPTTFSPKLAYTMADTFKSMEAMQLAAGKEESKIGELTRSGSVTPSGKMIFTNKKGEQYVDGKLYTGASVKPKVGVTGGGVGIPSEGKIMGALKGGKPNDAVEYAAQYLAFYGKLPPGMGRSKGGDAVREKAFARVSEIAKDAGMTLPELFAAGADVKASVAAMSKQKGLMTVAQSNEAQAQKNLTRLEGLYEKLGNGTIPVLNSVINRFKKGLGAPEPGTAEAVAYETMIEYTKVITGQTTGAVPTDSAMKNTADLINVIKDNPAMIKQKFTQFRGLMVDKLKSQGETYNKLKADLGKGVTAAGVAPASTPPSGPSPTAKIPAGAQTGTYHGQRAYTTDGGKSFFSEETGKRL